MTMYTNPMKQIWSKTIENVTQKHYLFGYVA